MMYAIVYISLVGCLIGLTLLSAIEAISWKNKPTDKSVAKGGTVTFQCEVNDRQGKPVIWNKGSTSLSSNSAVTREFQDRYSISGEFNLVIQNVQETDNDLFMCNVFDLGSAPAKLTVLLPPNPPVIQRNVTGNPYREKQVVAFTCESNGGNPDPMILWYKNGKEIVEATKTPSVTIGGASSSRIIVTLDSTDHQANYSCVVYNEANKNSPLSTFILLQVQYPPYLTFGPYNPYNVELGDNTRLECRVDSNPQVNTVTWLKNGQPYLKQNKLLTFNPIVKSDSGNYTCRATNGIGPSKEATAYLQAVYAPEITVPGSKTYRETEKIEIDCVIDSYPQPFLVRWEKIDVNRSKISYGPKLTINNSVREDAGNYTCKAWSELRVSGQRTQNVTGQGYTYIHIQYGPGEAFISPVSDVEVGKPLVIKCSAKPDGYPAATYKWEKDGVVLQQTTSTYRITTSQLQDNGLYKCTPVNLVSQGRSKQIQVNVNQIPTFISKPAIEITLPITHRQMLSITCKAKGRPPPVIHWYKDDGKQPITITQPNFYEVENKDVTLETYSTEVTNTLYIRGSGRTVQDNENTALRIEDMGQYHCWVNSSFYREPIKATQTLNLQFKPVVTTDEVRIAVNFSLPIQLPCTAQAFPVPKFQWYRKGVEIVGGPGRFSIGTTQIDGVSKYRSTLTINNVKTQDLGYYNCFASNNLGNVSQNIHLSTKTAPESPLNLHSTHQTWESAILVWDEGFDGGYPQYFILKVSTLGGEERLVEVNPPSATTFNVTNLKPQTTYSFVVFGQNQLGRGNSSRQLIVKTAELSIPSIGPSVEFNVQSGEITLENKIKDNYCLRVSVKRKNSAGKWDIAYQCLYFTDLVGNLQESNIEALNISVCLKDRPDVCGEPVTATLSEAGGATLTERDVYIIASVCGVIIITLLIILIIFICRRKKNQAKYEDNKTDTERRTQPVNGVQQPKKQQVYENQDGPLDLKHNHGNGYLPNGHATANGHVPHDTSYDSHVDKRMFENEMNRRNENVGRVDYNNRQGADIHFHGVPKSPSKDQYIDLEEKKEGSLQSNPESGYSTPDPSKPKKVIYEVVV
ncbi:hemicentin-2 isoform X2 [Patella vulgata]|uniref:hemicentin-2 isoform X2 n=1 Tax=Patella vulgata TaxID=6465 RepID=UPI0024A8CD7C|nr:hemicentin-2 isoform X2 [Patella vulgata]